MNKRWKIGCLLVLLWGLGCAPSAIFESDPQSTSTTALRPTLIPIPSETGTSTKVIEDSHFQIGNTRPVLVYMPKSSPELVDNKIGDMYSLYPQANPDHPGYENPMEFADRIASHGLKWMRVSLDWFDGNELEETKAYSTFDVHPQQDAAVDALLEQGVAVSLALVFWDEFLGASISPSRFADAVDLERYLDYVEFVVSHFKGRVQYYSLLNEPNIGMGTQQYVDPQDYMELASKAIALIREIDPAAKVIIGEITPLIWPDSIRYLETILESDVLSMADGLSWHAAGWSSPEFMAEEYFAYQVFVPEIVKRARKNGFQGDFWATENHWRTVESSHPEEYDGYTGFTAAKYLARSVVWHRGQGFYVGLAENLEHPQKEPVIENLCTLFAGAEPVEVAISIEPHIDNLQYFTFQTPTGNLLISIWTDNVAQEVDSGLPVTVKVYEDGFSKLTGVDVLLGIVQDLEFTEEEAGETVLSDLFVRDIPTIIIAQR